MDGLNKSDVLKVIKSIKGDYLQEIPAFSAKKVKGKPLYFYARKGIEIDKKKERVKIYDIELLSLEKDLLKLRICCSSGTYIRSIANDIGKQLKTGAALYALQRTKIGGFYSDNAAEIENIRDLEKNKEYGFLFDLKRLAKKDSIFINKASVDKIKGGYPLTYDMIDFSGSKNKSFTKNALVALKDSKDNIIAYHKVLDDIDFLNVYDHNLNLTKIISK